MDYRMLQHCWTIAKLTDSNFGLWCDFQPPMMPNTKTLTVSPELLETLFKSPREFHQEMIERKIQAKGMPEDAKIVGCEWDLLRNFVVFHVQSASFVKPEPALEVWYGIEPPKNSNGFTKDGNIAGDYLEAGTDPNLPRQTPAEIEQAITNLEPEE